MFTDYSALENYVVQPKISLASIWVLSADASYDVPRKGLQPDSIYWDELICIRTVSGNGVVKTFSGQAIDVPGETMLLIRMRDIQRYRCAGGNWQFWWFSFITDDMEAFRRNKALKAGLLENEKEKVYECMGLLNEENVWSQRTACAIFSELLFQWLSAQTETRSFPFANENVIARACSYMRMNIDKPLKIEELANQYGFSENQFRNLFERKYGMPPKRYLTMQRTNAVKALLNQTCLSVSDIAQRLGYSSQFHLTKEFKQITGMNPREYRKR